MDEGSRSVEGGLWTATMDCGLWTVDCGLWTVDCGLGLRLGLGLGLGLRAVGCGLYCGLRTACCTAEQAACVCYRARPERDPNGSGEAVAADMEMCKELAMRADTCFAGERAAVAGRSQLEDAPREPGAEVKKLGHRSWTTAAGRAGQSRLPDDDVHVGSTTTTLLRRQRASARHSSSHKKILPRKSARTGTTDGIAGNYSIPPVASQPASQPAAVPREIP